MLRSRLVSVGATVLLAITTLLLPGSGPSAVAGGAAVFQAQSPQIAMDAEGNTIAVWVRYNQTHWQLESRYRPAGGSWRPMRVIAEAYSEPQVAIDGKGVATVVWDADTIHVVRSTEGGPWSKPTQLSATGAGDPRVAVNPKGSVVVAWSRHDGTHSRIQASVRRLNGTWYGPITLSPAEQDAYLPAVAIDPAARSTVVWRQEAATREIQASSRPSGGLWTLPAETISKSGVPSDEPDVAADPDGNVVAAWQADTGTNTRIQTTRQKAGGEWGSPKNLSKDGRDAQDAQVVVGKDGKAAVAWSREDSLGWTRVQVSRRASGSWTDPATLSPTESHGYQPTLAMSPRGRIVLSWTQLGEADVRVRARTYKAKKGWSANTKLSAGSTSETGSASPAITPGGAMAAIWVWFDGTRPRVQTSRRSANGSSWTQPAYLSAITP